MDNNVLVYGSPECVKIDYNEQTTQIFLKKAAEPNIMRYWAKHYGSLENVVVLMSGGVDSQFQACLAQKLCNNVKAITVRFRWNGICINANDVVMASEFCEKRDIEHSFVDFDLNAFYGSGQLKTVAEKYRTLSPQVAAHIASFENIVTPGQTLLVGGDIPMLGMFAGRAFTPFKWSSDTATKQAYAGTYYKNILAPYLLLEHYYEGVRVIKDPFHLCPETLYLAYKRNAHVISETASIIDFSQRKTFYSSYKYRIAYYESFGFELTPPLAKRTGFEMLKVHLASETGYYDEYDKLYREPLEAALRSEPRNGWLGDGYALQTHFTCEGFEFSEIESAVDDILADTARPISLANMYNFDW